MIQKSLVFLLFFLSISSIVIAQQLATAQGGELIIEQEECLSLTQTNQIISLINNSVAELRLEGKLAASSANDSKAITKFSWPLRQTTGFDQPDYYTTINYVDLDNSPGTQDFQCGSRTYDGHNGLDISLWPFWWKMMDEDQVEVIAGAPGTIIFKQDDNFDQNCTCTGNWNAVYVQHADGSIAWYGHLKTNSLTNIAVGESINEGDYIGVVGSSGCSSNPHLHLEIRDENNTVIETFAGTCNQTTTESWWQDQKSYREPALNLLMTHSVPPNLNAGFCPSDESPNFQTQFDPGSTIYFGAYYRDHLVTDPTDYVVRSPDGEVYSEWTHSSNGDYSSSWWYWNFTIPATSMQGTWAFEATFKGETKVHEFQIGLDVAIEELPNIKVKMYPNPVQENFTLEVDHPGILQYELINVNGQTIQAGMLNFPSNQISMTKLSEGIYFLQIRDYLGALLARKCVVKVN